MSKWILVLSPAILLGLSGGCHFLPKCKQVCDAPPPPPVPAQPEGETIRVKVPPQKIVIEQQPCAPVKEVIQAPEKEQPTPKKESQPEAARQPERRPEAEAARPESTLGTLAALGQVASFTRTTAMTSPLGTVTPGSAGLGVGLRWIHIPIPCLRIFTIQENPTITVPLNEANLVTAGFPEAYPGLLAGQRELAGCGRGLTRQEIAALLAEELAARRTAPPRVAAPSPPPTDAERARLEKKLAEAEAQIQRLSETLKAIDDKLPASK